MRLWSDYVHCDWGLNAPTFPDLSSEFTVIRKWAWRQEEEDRKFAFNINYVTNSISSLTWVSVLSILHVGWLVSFQDSPDGEKCSEPKMEVSGSSGGELSPPKTGGTSVTSYASLPSKPVVKPDPLPPSALSKAPTPSSYLSTLSTGDRASVRKPISPMESLMGNPRRYGDGTTRSTTHLTSSDLLRGPKPYVPWDVPDLNRSYWLKWDVLQWRPQTFEKNRISQCDRRKFKMLSVFRWNREKLHTCWGKLSCHEKWLYLMFNWK